MKTILLSIFISTLSYAFTDPKIGGTVNVKSPKTIVSNQQSVLYIEVYKANSELLIAKSKIANPKFPQAFVVTPKNVISPKENLEGRVKVAATYYPNGESSSIRLFGVDKSHLEVEVGKKDLNIELSQN